MRDALCDGARRKWAPDGKRVYYLCGELLYRAQVRTDRLFRVMGEDIRVLRIRGDSWIRFLDVSPDDNFVIVSGNDVELEVGTPPKNYATLMWWQNWAQSLEKE